MLDNFASCVAAVFELNKCFIFLLFRENIGSYDGLLLHYGGGKGGGVPSSNVDNSALVQARLLAAGDFSHKTEWLDVL